MFNLMPEKYRTFSRNDADYALVTSVFSQERHDNVIQGTNTKADGVYNTWTNAYLCAPDGSFSKLGGVKHDPPSRGKANSILKGSTASSEELWEAIHGWLG